MFYDSIWQYCSDNGGSTGPYIVFYQGRTIDHWTHVPGPVSQSSSENEYNAACTVVMSLAHFRVLRNELLNKYPDVVPEQAPLIILDSKLDVCSAKNCKDTKNTK